MEQQGEASETGSAPEHDRGIPKPNRRSDSASIETFSQSKSKTPETAAPHEFRKVRLADIDLDDLTFQLRVEMRLGDIKESLDEAGQLDPIHLLGPAPYRIIDGFRRCNAARALGWNEVEAAVYDQLDQRRAFQFAFAHNAVRKNLRPIDKANAIRLAMKAGLSRRDVAAELLMSEKQVGRYLALLRLPREVQEAIDEREFTMAHALAVAEFDVGNITSVVREVRAKEMTAAQLRKSLRCALGSKKVIGRPRQFVAREGGYIRFRGDFLLSAPKSDRERLAAQLIDLVAVLQRGSNRDE